MRNIANLIMSKRSINIPYIPGNLAYYKKNNVEQKFTPSQFSVSVSVSVLS